MHHSPTPVGHQEATSQAYCPVDDCELKISLYVYGQNNLFLYFGNQQERKKKKVTLVVIIDSPPNDYIQAQWMKRT